MKILLIILFAAIGGVAACGLYGLDELPALRLLGILVSVVGVAGSVFAMSTQRTRHDDWLRVLSDFADRDVDRSNYRASDALANSSVCV